MQPAVSKMDCKFDNMTVKSARGFTIAELLVAMALLVMLLTLSGLVFSTTVQAHRQAGASIEVSRNLRAVAEQINADFRGLRKEAPLFLWFNAVDTNGDAVPDTYYDAIHFFADGDFQAAQTPLPNKMIYGNAARIYYGHANSVNLIANPIAVPDFKQAEILARRCHILTADSQLLTVMPYPNLGIPPDYSIFINPAASQFLLGNENVWEYDTISLTDWINTLNYSTNNAGYFLRTVMFDTSVPDGNISRPMVNIDAADGLWNLFCQGVVQMQIQWAYQNEDLVSFTGLAPAPPLFIGVRWWPDVDPVGNGNVPPNDVDSDFSLMGVNKFGVCFTLPKGTTDTIANWYMVNTDNASKRCQTLAYPFRKDFYPKALKFTFVLKDSNGIFADGKIFTHIVYIGD